MKNRPFPLTDLTLSARCQSVQVLAAAHRCFSAVLEKVVLAVPCRKMSTIYETSEQWTEHVSGVAN